MLILHIVKREVWDKAESEGSYESESLTLQGFIHCSTPEQVIKVANSNFLGKTGLVLLCIDTDKLESSIRFETGGYEFYPHIYGPLNLEAVIKAYDFEPGPDGRFSLPSEVSELAKSLKK
jgi:uncharacterized protein (DUF952 family)